MDTHFRRWLILLAAMTMTFTLVACDEAEKPVADEFSVAPDSGQMKAAPAGIGQDGCLTAWRTAGDRLSLSLSSSAISFVDGLPAAPDADLDLIYGTPRLPVRYFQFALPPDTDLLSLDLKSAAPRTTTALTDIDVPPAPPLAPPVPGLPPLPELRNPEVYGKDAFYPEQPVRIADTGRLGGYPYVTVEYYPYQYNPVRRELRAIRSLEAAVNYRAADRPDPRDEAARRSAPIARRAAETFINFNDLYADPDGLPQDGEGYALVTTNDYVANCDTIQTFLERKEKTNGFTTYLVTEDDYGAYPGDAAAQIRGWLADNYAALSLGYVLLVGNPNPTTGDVPMRQTYPRAGTTWYWEYLDGPTDYYYADLTGDWDIDGDGKYGEGLNEYNDMPAGLPLPSSYSIRWTGEFTATETGNHTFTVVCFGEADLYVNDLVPPLVHCASSGNGYVQADAAVSLTAGDIDMQVDFSQPGADGLLYIQWESAGHEADYLTNAQTRYWDGAAYQAGLYTQFFNEPDFTDPLTAAAMNSLFDYVFWSGDRKTGGMDREPEVLVGRIPVYGNNYAQLSEILLKTMNYERQTFFANADRMNFLLPMKPSDDLTPGYHLGEEIRDDYLIPAGYDSTRVYEEVYGLTPPPEYTPCNSTNVLDAWQNGYGGVVWWTHGSSTSASSVFSSSLCPQLDDSKPAIVFQGSCLNGRPETTNNLGAELLENGAVGTVSASRVSWYWVGQQTFGTLGSNASMGYHFTNYLTAENTIGESLWTVRGSATLWVQSLANTIVFNLYGDPAVYLLPPYPVNHAPIAHARNLYAPVGGGPQALNLQGSDVDGDDLLFTVVNHPVFGVLSGTAPNLTYTPLPAYAGSDAFTFQVNDGLVDSTVVTVTVTGVDPGNSPPVAYDQNLLTEADDPLDVFLTASDLDGDELSYAITVGPAHGALSGTPPDLTYTPGGSFAGVDSFAFTANDGQADSNEATISITNACPDCTIASACYADGELNPANPCEMCDLDVSATAWSPSPAGTTCRAENGICDVAEECTGLDTSCPDDEFQPDAVQCRTAAGFCDVAEYCSGAGAACPADAYKPDTTLCRSSVGICDIAEYCTGADEDCPADAFLPDTTICRASAGVCDVAEYCSGAAAACPDNAYSPDTTLCRSSVGICDIAEYCTGADEDCPADALQPGTFTCRAAAGVCDVAELCTGSQAACPADSYLPDTSLCRASNGLCDIAEYCTGAEEDCPADALQPDTFECRAAAGACDVVEFCTGADAACPADAFLPDTTLCRASNGLCDVAEYCTGADEDCPSDAFLPDTTICRVSVDVCDVEEYCTGSAAACPANAFEPDTTICRASIGLCDVAEYCTGADEDCPADALQPGTTECRAAAGECDVAELCTGTQPACPVDDFLDATTLCRAATGGCDLPDYCTGDAADCPADSFKPDGEPCDAGWCVEDAACDAGQCLGDDRDCGDQIPCSVDTCDADARQCLNDTDACAAVVIEPLCPTQAGPEEFDVPIRIGLAAGEDYFSFTLRFDAARLDFIDYTTANGVLADWAEHFGCTLTGDDGDRIGCSGINTDGIEDATDATLVTFRFAPAASAAKSSGITGPALARRAAGSLHVRESDFSTREFDFPRKATSVSFEIEDLLYDFEFMTGGTCETSLNAGDDDDDDTAGDDDDTVLDDDAADDDTGPNPNDNDDDDDDIGGGDMRANESDDGGCCG